MKKSSIRNIAKICHEVNRAYCAALGDRSQKPWEEAPPWQQHSAMDGVSFHLKNNATPEQSHANWMKDKAASGWVYGPVKDEALKQHPCMVPYDQLPQEQRVKDYLFRAIVHAHKDTK
jgi:hypothetical protein